MQEQLIATSFSVATSRQMVGAVLLKTPKVPSMITLGPGKAKQGPSLKALGRRMAIQPKIKKE